MAETKQFSKGLIVKKPNPNAPSYVICNLSFKKDEFIEWLKAQPDNWVNVGVNNSDKGVYYSYLDTWKPNQNNNGI